MPDIDGKDWHPTQFAARFQHRLFHFYRTSLVFLPAFWRRPSASWRQVLAHSSSAVPVASDAAAAIVAMASHKPRVARPKQREETMHELPIRELMKLTRSELCGLATRLTLSLPVRPEQSVERTKTLRCLHDIRQVLAWYDMAPE